MRSGGFSALLLVLVAGCTPQEARYKPDDPGAVMGGEDEKVDVEKAKAFIEKAVAALRDEELEAARKHLASAEPFADEMKRDEIRSIRQSIDSAEADKYVPGINKSADAGKCEEALDTAIEVIDGKKDTAIPAFVKERTSKQLLKCLLGQLKVDLSIGRELAESEKLEKALSKDDLVKYQSKVTDDTVEELIGRFTDPIDQRKWVEAKTLLDELVERKEAGAREYNKIMGVLRKGIIADIASKTAAALEDKKGVSEVLVEVDKLVAIAEWGKKAGSAVGGEAMPKEVQLHRDTLALWKVCSDFNCNMVSPRQDWAYGHVDLQPALDPKADKTTLIKHATPVWRLADSAGWILIAKDEPKNISDVASRVPVAAGWVKAAGLKSEDTAAWLPPGDSIIGTRVWGPLREGQKELELGTVIKVKNNDVAVERLADGSIIEVARAQVRFGTVTKGTKVLARCVHAIKLEPAVIDSVKFPPKGDPVVSYTCVGGEAKKGEDQLGAVRAKAADLPARR